MYENEPRMLFNQPLSGMVGLTGTAVLLSQIFCLFFITFPFMYFLEMIVCFTMLLLLSLGTRKRKPGHVMGYCAFLAMYIFWTTFGMIALIWTYIYLKSDHCDVDEHEGSTTTIVSCKTLMNGSDTAFLVLGIITCSISIFLSIYQCRLCFLLFKLMKQQALQQQVNVSYHTGFPLRDPNMPPQYSQTQQQAGPLPDKPPGYAEAVAALNSSMLAQEFQPPAETPLQASPLTTTNLSPCSQLPLTSTMTSTGTSESQNAVNEFSTSSASLPSRSDETMTQFAPINEETTSGQHDQNTSSQHISPSNPFAQDINDDNFQTVSLESNFNERQI